MAIFTPKNIKRSNRSYTIKEYKQGLQMLESGARYTDYMKAFNLTASQARNFRDRIRKQYTEPKHQFTEEMVPSQRKGALIEDLQYLQSRRAWKKLMTEDPEKYKSIRNRAKSRLTTAMNKIASEGLVDTPAYEKYMNPDNYALITSDRRKLTQDEEIEQMMLIRDLLVNYKTSSVRKAREEQERHDMLGAHFSGSTGEFTESDMWHIYDRVKAQLGMSTEELMGRLGYGYSIVLQEMVVDALNDWSGSGKQLYSEYKDKNGRVNREYSQQLIDILVQSIANMLNDVVKRNTRSSDALRKFASSYKPKIHIISDDDELPFD